MYAINAQNNARSTECLTCALDAGELLLTYGAEVSRVEDTIQRLEHVCGFDLVDVFTITSSIVATVRLPDGGSITQPPYQGTCHQFGPGSQDQRPLPPVLRRGSYAG